jgi:hypothetical protein
VASFVLSFSSNRERPTEFSADRARSDRHPSWSRRNSPDLQTLAGTATATSILRVLTHEHRSCDRTYPIMSEALATVSVLLTDEQFDTGL